MSTDPRIAELRAEALLHSLAPELFHSYFEGQLANYDGLPREQNPYRQGSFAGLKWYEGFDAAAVIHEEWEAVS